MAAAMIRPLEGGDVEAVAGIWNRALKRDPITTGRFVSWLYGDGDYRPGADSGFFVAEQGGEVAGFVRGIVRHWPNDRVGLEAEEGWIPVLAVEPANQRRAVGRELLHRVLEWFRGHGRKRIWVCGNSGSAPGYVFPGVDEHAYPAALRLLKEAGFVVDHPGVSMSREVVDFDVDAYRAQAWETGGDVVVEELTPPRVQDFLSFLAESFPGDWNVAARGKIRGGALHEVLVARLGERIVGYCQWEGEHFGPFGVSETLRSHRIGAKLFVEAVARIRAADGRTVWFNWADPGAARFYGRFGLQAIRHFSILYKDL